MSYRLFVGNLPWTVGRSELISLNMRIIDLPKLTFKPGTIHIILIKLILKSYLVPPILGKISKKRSYVNY